MDKRNATRRNFLQQAAALTGGVVAGNVAPLGARPDQAPAPASAPRPLSKGAKFRALLKKPGITLVPETYSVFAARLAELNGFDAIYVGGNMMSALYLGLEDWGLIQTTELIEIGSRIGNSVDIPAIVDGDQLGETALNVYRSIKSYERAGIAATHLEDTRNPKHRGQGKSDLMPLDEMLLRIEAATEARADTEFVIIARSDCLILGPNRGSTDEAIRRGTAFAKAGADAFFCVGMQKEQVDPIARAVPIPLIALNIPMPDVSNTQLKMNIHAVQLYQPAMKLYETMILELKEHGQFLRLPERRLSPETMAKVMRTDKYAELAERWQKVRG